LFFNLKRTAFNLTLVIPLCFLCYARLTA